MGLEVVVKSGPGAYTETLSVVFLQLVRIPHSYTVPAVRPNIFLCEVDAPVMGINIQEAAPFTRYCTWYPIELEAVSQPNVALVLVIAVTLWLIGALQLGKAWVVKFGPGA